MLNSYSEILKNNTKIQEIQHDLPWVQHSNSAANVICMSVDPFTTYYQEL